MRKLRFRKFHYYGSNSTIACALFLTPLPHLLEMSTPALHQIHTRTQAKFLAKSTFIIFTIKLGSQAQLSLAYGSCVARNVFIKGYKVSESPFGMSPWGSKPWPFNSKSLVSLLENL